MEHFKEEDKYVATGNVKLEKDKTVVYADRAVLFEKAAYVEVEGHVIYEDPTTLINSERAELSLDTRTGKMYNAVILLKDQKAKAGAGGKIDFWVNSDKVEKIDDSHYYATAATFTSCETIAEVEGRYKSPYENKVFGADSPDWCFKGSNVDILIGDRVAGKNMVYRVDGLPLLYSPYFRLPVGKDRETGLLTPLFGNSSVKGFQFSPKFFWAIDENKDATLSLDYYSKRGTGEGLEYRYLDFDDKGKWSVYHLSDSVEHKTNLVFKGSHDQMFGDIKTYVDINYVNQWDYYNQFSTQRSERIERYTQSSGEISVPFKDSRLYLLGQYWVDLQQPPQLQTPPLPAQPNVAQRLPELGYVVNTTSIGPLLFSMNSSIANFTRSTNPGVQSLDINSATGQRLDINPTISYTFGDWVQFFQSLSLDETAYKLSNMGTTIGTTTTIGTANSTVSSDPHRETLQYTAKALTRFFKQYESGTNSIEPSISYSFNPAFTTHPLPLFDSVDWANKIAGNNNKSSLGQIAVLDTLTLKSVSISTRLIQPYDLTAVAPAHPLQPTELDWSISHGPYSLNLTMTDDLNTMIVQTFNGSLSATVYPGTTASIGRYYTYAAPPAVSTEQYSFSVTSVVSKTLTAAANVFYDSNVGLRDYALHAIYTKQCWSIDASFQRKPPDTIHPSETSLLFLLTLKGLGTLPAIQ